jgi:hypothetical protein
VAFKRRNNVSGVESVQVPLRWDPENKPQQVSESVDGKDNERLASAGLHAVLEGRASREGVDLIAMGHECDSRKLLSFICHKDAGATECTDFYKVK